MSEIILELKGISKSFGNTGVLKDISLQIEKGEFVTILGSSGCGKTTTLRIIAGLETPDEGSVFLAGEDVTDVAPEKRDVNTVFQSYALFPHMNVYDNVAYGLKLKKVSKAEIKQRVSEVLEMVQLIGYEKRMPSQLSGGQKQRVAIARAIINKPKLLLLDEPLGALDLQLRRQMQMELKRLQKLLGITFIYITHDQEEAINMSSRIIVMRDGGWEQVGTPDEVYHHPRTSYVAQFVGNANILKGTVQEKTQEHMLVRIGQENMRVLNDSRVQEGMPVTIAVRSENVLVSRTLPGVTEGEDAVVTGTVSEPETRVVTETGLSAIVKEKSYAGGMLRVTLTLPDGKELTASRHGIDADFSEGETVYCSWKPEQAVLVDVEDKNETA